MGRIRNAFACGAKLKMALCKITAASAEAADSKGVSTAGQMSAEPITPQPQEQQAPLSTETPAGGTGSVLRIGDCLHAGGFELHPSLGGTSEGSRIEGIASAASAQTGESSPRSSDANCSVDWDEG